MSTELVEYRDPTPMALLQIAVEKNLDPDRLEKLLTLQERWQKSRAEEAYNVAMHACQEEMPIIVKDAQNEQTKSRYASLENVKKIAKPIYTKHKFTLSFAEAEATLPNHKRTICDVRHNAGHSVRYHVELPVDGVGPKGNPIGGMNPVQGSISSLSYGERVLTCMIFDLTIAQTDIDGQRRSIPITEEQIATLKELLESSDANLEKFYNWAAIRDLKEMTQDFYPAALAELRRKQARQQKQSP